MHIALSAPTLPPSYWIDTLAPPPPRRLPGDLEVDLAIVGGGFTGLATALELRRTRPEMRVAVLEQGIVGHGASGRNGGFSMTLFGLTLETTVWRFGKERTAAAFAYMREAVASSVALIEQEQIACDLEHTGMLVVANCPAQWRRLEHEVALARRLGIDTLELWDGERLRCEVASPLYHGARFDPDCAILNPWKLAHGLRAAVEQHGGEVYEQCGVRSVVPDGAGVVLETAGGRVRSRQVVLATNAYSTWLPALDRLAAPVFTYIVVTEPLSAEQLGSIGWRGRQGIEDARNLVHYYRLTADNRLLMGGGAVRYVRGGRPDDPALAQDEALRRDLERFVIRVFPGLEGVRFPHHWGGPVSVPLDMAPALGRLGGDGRIFYSLGCVGHGVSLSLMNGKVLNDLALGLDTPRARMFFVNRRVPPFPPEPLRYALAHGIRGALVAQDRWQERGVR